MSSYNLYEKNNPLISNVLAMQSPRRCLINPWEGEPPLHRVALVTRFHHCRVIQGRCHQQQHTAVLWKPAEEFEPLCVCGVGTWKISVDRCLYYLHYRLENQGCLRQAALEVDCHQLGQEWQLHRPRGHQGEPGASGRNRGTPAGCDWDLVNCM